ncbi:MAG: ketoacyl-ACP synthase III [Tannerellaceae bacterium]|jgi:3-oxoacyl-[acyl-carrier-protein] synthase-3|nr:ketoacyl-ACP synthase III [Tannerellaceae bacterium]
MTQKINAMITGIGGYVPEDVLTNTDIAKMVDTTDEWILTRVGISERRILREGLGTSYMGTKAVEQLLAKTKTNAEDIEALICATTTPDYFFPTAASMIAHNTGCVNALTFDMQAACTGFLYALEAAANFIRSGRVKKLIVVAGDTMTSITDYTDRTTCPLFGDGCGAVLIEPTYDNVGIIDAILKSDGNGLDHLNMKGGGSAFRATHDTIDQRLHYVYQDGRAVFKHAVMSMTNVSIAICERHKLQRDDVDWIVPHQANKRIIDAVAKHLGVEDKVMVNIQKRGNTSAGTIPICLWEYEDKLKKGHNIILTAFGAGFTWGAVYLKWAYD